MWANCFLRRVVCTRLQRKSARRLRQVRVEEPPISEIKNDFGQVIETHVVNGTQRTSTSFVGLRYSTRLWSSDTNPDFAYRTGMRDRAAATICSAQTTASR